MVKLVVLNALPLNALPDETLLEIYRNNRRLLEAEVSKAGTVECYIRHPATVRVAERILGRRLECKPGIYKWQAGDVLVVFTLRKPVRTGEEVNVTEDDVDFYIVYVSRIEDLL